MKHYFPTMATLAISLMSSVLVPTLKADEENKLTNITIDQSIDVQGTVLPPGSYVMKLLGSPANRTTVLIFNADENHLIATILAIPAYRLQPTGDSKFMFYESKEGHAPALHTWFYPGGQLRLRVSSPQGKRHSQFQAEQPTESGRIDREPQLAYKRLPCGV